MKYSDVSLRKQYGLTTKHAPKSETISFKCEHFYTLPAIWREPASNEDMPAYCLFNSGQILHILPGINPDMADGNKNVNHTCAHTSASSGSTALLRQLDIITRSCCLQSCPTISSSTCDSNFRHIMCFNIAWN